MRGEIVYRVYGVHKGRDEDVFFGAFRTAQEAQAEVEHLKAMEMHGRNWADQYHNKGFVIREVAVDTDFEIPSRPKPRDKYVVKTSAKANRPGTWDSTIVEVFRRDVSSADIERVCEYERNYGMLQTFEPFRQGSREFALISRDYTRSEVLDLDSGEVIGEEAQEGPHGAGFCPVGFYVPDWWDVHDGSIIPGSESWNTDYQWPNGTFGFVWGCHWGDDSSWKVQYLDLNRIQEGVIRRDDRFGYVELATSGFESPCLTLDPGTLEKSGPPHFIRVSRYDGIAEVMFAVEMAFDLDTGKSKEWRRLEIENLE
jgi:hypothetical protein